MKHSIPLLLAGCMLATVNLNAQVILSPTSVVHNTLGSFDPSISPDRTIDQSGLLTPFVSGVTNFNSYIAGNPLHDFTFTTEFFAPSGVFTGSIDYDLGATYSVDRMAFWDEDAWGVKTVQIFGSSDSSFSSSVGFGTFVLADTPDSVNYGPQVLTFSQTSDVRYVRIAILDDQPGAQSASIGEIALSASPAGPVGAVPEPSTYGMMGAAALVGVALWRKRRKA